MEGLEGYNFNFFSNPVNLVLKTIFGFCGNREKLNFLFKQFEFLNWKYLSEDKFQSLFLSGLLSSVDLVGVRFEQFRRVSW